MWFIFRVKYILFCNKSSLQLYSTRCLGALPAPISSWQPVWLDFVPWHSVPCDPCLVVVFAMPNPSIFIFSRIFNQLLYLYVSLGSSGHHRWVRWDVLNWFCIQNIVEEDIECTAQWLTIDKNTSRMWQNYAKDLCWNVIALIWGTLRISA